MIEVVDPGPLATVQDLGRPRSAALGVPRSGAFDRAALRLANRLVDNDGGAGGIEVTFGGLALRAVDAVTVALTGAPCPRAPDWGVAVTLAAGTTFRLGVPAAGLRSYLGVRGGVAVDPTLGSRSTDTLSVPGPPALRAAGTAGRRPARRRIGVRRGERDGCAAGFGAATLQVRSGRGTTGSPPTGRPRLERTRDGELPSEPMLPGALQVPPDGRPILFGPDAPVTGGYPVIAVVGNLDRAAQLRPGDVLRFSTTG